MNYSITLAGFTFELSLYIEGVDKPELTHVEIISATAESHYKELTEDAYKLVMPFLQKKLAAEFDKVLAQWEMEMTLEKQGV